MNLTKSYRNFSPNKYFSLNYIIRISVLLFCLLFSVVGATESYLLTAKPKRCIKPRGEAACAVILRFSWQSSIMGDYCLHIRTHNQPLKCWLKATRGNLNTQFNSKSDLIYELRPRNSDTVLADVKIPIAYALKQQRYPLRKRRLWRVF